MRAERSHASINWAQQVALTVRDIMDADPITVEHGRLVGMVTRVDVLEALTRDQQ